MKARSFLLAVVLAVVLLLGAAAGLWWSMVQQSPLRLAEQPLELPRAARFVPRQSALSLHWLVDPGRLPAYAQAVAPTRQRRSAREGMEQLRDGAFALAGLDYTSELADWLGPQVSLALLEPAGAEGAMGWVLALASRDDDGARRFLQRFWQTRSLAGTDLQISRYRGIGVISGRGALLGRDPQPLATALIDDDLLLLASGRGVLEQALDGSQLDELHQLGDQELSRQLRQLGHGVALLTASPAAMETWLGFSAALSQRKDLEGLVAALVPERADLQLEGRLRFRSPVIRRSGAAELSAPLLRASGGPADALALLEKPAQLLKSDVGDPLDQWLGPILRSRLERIGSPALEVIAELDEGPLLWEHLNDGWLLGSRDGRPDDQAVDAQLKQKGLVRSNLPGESASLNVWTQLQRQRSHGKEALEAQLAVALESEAGVAWWSNALEALHQRRDQKALEPRLDQLEALAADGASLQQLALAEQGARDQLQQWRPWTLLQAVAGRSLLPAVHGMAMAVSAGEAVSADIPAATDQAEASDTLRFRARLSFA
jgi:hypothetical protein